MGFFDVYSYLLANWINGGNFIKRSRMNATDIVCDYNMIYTKSSFKKVFRIVGIKPENVDIDFVSYIRDQMFLTNPNVECIISTQNYPVKVDVTSDKFNRAFSRANDQYTSYSEAFNSQSGLAKLTGKTYRLPGGGSIRLSKEKLDDLKQVFVSYHYVFDYVSGGGTTCLTELFVELVGKTITDVKRAGDDLFNILGPLNMGCEEVKGVLKTYLTECGAAIAPPYKLNKKFLPQLLFTDQNSAAFAPYRSRGLVGGSGILFGLDKFSSLPLSIDIFAAPSAQVFLLMGKTGSGKTYAAFQIALSALARGEYVTALDIKGREWSKLSSIVPTKIITFDEKNPSFVNTLRLDDIEADKHNAGELYATAIKGTVSFLMLIVNLQENEGNPSDLELVLREAVSKLFTMRGVTPDNPATFADTATMKYSDLLPVLESLASTTTYTDSQRAMLKLARARCNAYIGDSGIFADAFRNEVTLGDVMTSPLVIYEFNKNQNAMTDSLDVLRIFMVQFLDSKKKAALRARGKFLFAFYEELQRCDQFGNLLEYICAETTGSRSNNAVIVLLLNSLKVLEGERARDIRSNITSFVVGSVEANDIETIREGFNQPWLARQLELFAEHPNRYRNCFAIVADTGKDIFKTAFKVEFPDYLSVKFQTRTTKDNKAI